MMWTLYNIDGMECFPKAILHTRFTKPAIGTTKRRKMWLMIFATCTHCEVVPASSCSRRALHC